MDLSDDEPTSHEAPPLLFEVTLNSIENGLRYSALVPSGNWSVLAGGLTA